VTYPIEEFLRRYGISYERFDHEAVFTVEESEKLPPMPGFHTKNLFLFDEKSGRHILVVVGHDKRVDLKALRALLGLKQLSFAPPERLKERLGVEPGSVTLLGIVHDTERAVEVLIDEAGWNAEAMACHPLANTATFCIPHAGIERFLEATGHVPRVLDIPARAVP
jgi:Ala-tRNA(Pro) deacylase